MTSATVLHAQSVTETTANSTTWVDVVSIVDTQFTAGHEYLLIAVCNVKGSSGVTDKGMRFVHGTTPTLFEDAQARMDPTVSDERLSVGFMHRFTQPGTRETIKLQIALLENSGTITNMYSSIIAIDLADFTENTDFYWNEATGDATDAASFTSRASVTFTPNGTDKWLLIGQATWDIGATGTNFSILIRDSVGPTFYGDTAPLGYPSQDTNDQYPFIYWVGVTPSNASHTFAVQTQSSTSQTVLSTRILALNLAKFSQSEIAYTAASDTPATDGSWETEASVSPTPSTTGNWIILANAVASAVSSSTLFARLQINPDGGGLVSDPGYGDDAPDDVGNSLSRGMPFNMMTVRQLTSGASRAINFDWQQASSQAATVRDRALIAFSIELAAGALEGTISQVSETDTAQTAIRTKSRTVGINSETDTSQAVSRRKSKAVGIISETDAAQPVSRVKTRTIGIVSEADISLSVTSRKTKQIGLVSETDASLAAHLFKTDTIGQVSESDTALGVAGRKTKGVGVVSETDEAQAVQAFSGHVIGIAEEQDLAQGVTSRKAKGIGVVPEQDTAQSVSAVRVRAIGQTVETDTPLGVTSAKQKTAGQVEEQDQAQAVQAVKTLEIGGAQEQDVALPVRASKRKSIGIVSESDQASPIVTGMFGTIDPAEESDQALTVTGAKRKSISLAEELNDSLGITPAKQKSVAIAAESEQALPVTAVKIRQIGIVSESGLAQSLFGVKVLTIAQVVEFDTAQSVTARKALGIGLAQEQDTALGVTAGAVVTTPEDRVYSVESQDRAYAIAWEDRAYGIKHEDRSLAIGDNG